MLPWDSMDFYTHFSKFRFHQQVWKILICLSLEYFNLHIDVPTLHLVPPAL